MGLLLDEAFTAANNTAFTALSPAWTKLAIGTEGTPSTGTVQSNAGRLQAFDGAYASGARWLRSFTANDYLRVTGTFLVEAVKTEHGHAISLVDAQSFGSEDEISFEFNPFNNQFAIGKVLNGTYTSGGIVTNTAFTWTAGSTYNIIFEAFKSTPSVWTARVKIWTGGTEPAAWTGAGTTSDAIAALDNASVQIYVGNTATTQTGTFDTLQIRSGPHVAASNTTNGTSGASNALNMPANIAAGDLLLAWYAQDAAGATDPATVSSGWSRIGLFSNTIKVAVFAKVAAGGDTITVTGTAQDFAAVTQRIVNHGVTTVGTDVLLTSTTGASGNVDPPSLGSLGTTDKLLVAAGATDMTNAGDTISVPPNGYTTDQNVKSASSTSSVGLHVAYNRGSAATEDPGAFTNTSRVWIGVTLAVGEPVASSSATAGHASGTGAANNAGKSVSVNAGHASGTGTAHNAGKTVALNVENAGVGGIHPFTGSDGDPAPGMWKPVTSNGSVAIDTNRLRQRVTSDGTDRYAFAYHPAAWTDFGVTGQLTMTNGGTAFLPHSASVLLRHTGDPYSTTNVEAYIYEFRGKDAQVGFGKRTVTAGTSNYESLSLASHTFVSATVYNFILEAEGTDLRFWIGVGAFAGTWTHTYSDVAGGVTAPGTTIEFWNGCHGFNSSGTRDVLWDNLNFYDLSKGGEAYDATISTAPSVSAAAGHASGTGTAHQPSVTVARAAGHASGTGTAHAAAINVGAAAAHASGTGSAHNAAGTSSASIGHASGTGTAHNAGRTVAVTAGHASGTGTASGATVAAAVSAGHAAGTGTAPNASSSVAVNAGHASGTGSAANPTISTASSAQASAGHASGTGTASNAAASVAASAGHAAGTGAALSATVDASASGTANAGHASGSGSALNASVSVTSNAGHASGTAAGYTAKAAIAVTAAQAAGVVEAFEALLSIAATAGGAAAVGAAYNASGTGAPPDPQPLTFTLRDRGHTLTLHDSGHLVTVHDRGHTATIGENR